MLAEPKQMKGINAMAKSVTPDYAVTVIYGNQVKSG
jgi:hypothetical protein